MGYYCIKKRTSHETIEHIVSHLYEITGSCYCVNTQPGMAVGQGIFEDKFSPSGLAAELHVNEPMMLDILCREGVNQWLTDRNTESLASIC